MIKSKDVVTLKVPFPKISSGLAKTPHMYICHTSGQDKKMIKVQTMKPAHILEMPCERYIIEESDSDRNPFRLTSIIDLDKIFSLTDIKIDASLLANRNICDEIYQKINEGTDNLSLCEIVTPAQSELLKLNYKLKTNS